MICSASACSISPAWASRIPIWPAANASPDADAHYPVDALLAPLATSLFVYQRRERGMSTDRIKAGLEYLLAGL